MEKIRAKVEELIKQGWTPEEIAQLATVVCKDNYKSSLEENEDDALLCKVSLLLKSIGIAVHVKGYNYLREAIIYTKNNPGRKIAATNELYPEIAKKFNTTSNRVERAIRHAIEKLWKKNANPELIKKIFFYEPGEKEKKPTNTEFILNIVEYLKFN